MIRVAFPLIGGRDWTGGYNYLLNLLQVIDAHAPGRIQPVVLFGPEVPEAERAPFAAIGSVEIVVDEAFGVAGRTRRLLESLVGGLDRAAMRVFHERRIDVVFEAAQFYGWRLPVPAIAWIPDFQHCHLPHLFSRLARLKRAIGFNAQIGSGRRIMLSSEDARTDCERFHPASRGRTSVVRFAIPRERTVDAAAAREAADRYGLPPTFFFLPNQFWIHKNHAVVIAALAILKGRGRPVVVVASGGQKDPRDPDHFERLMVEAAASGVAESFRPLGLIPYPDIALLMRASAALINPSLFEGWSTTVEEGKSTGTPMILSDLRVHREQTGGEAVYFVPRSASELADCLDGFRIRPPAEREDAATAALAATRGRVNEFADAFVAVVQTALDRR